MTALPGGMESDFSDSECELVFNTDSDIKEKKVGVPFTAPERPVSQTPLEKKPVSNGRTGNSFPKNSCQDRQKNRPFNKNNSQHRNKISIPRRQCLETKTSQVLDDLRYAIMQGNFDTVKSILAKGIMVDTVLQRGWSGLMFACSSGNHEIASYLLQMKADPNFHVDLFTPLMAVCASGKNEEDLLKCCSLLLEHGAQVNAHERHYTTSLMFAAREGFYNITKELLDHGANPNLQDNRGNTALGLSATHGHGRIVRLLLEKGAEKNTLNNMGQSPVDLAYENNHDKIASLLEKDKIEPCLVSDNSTELVKTPSIKEVVSPFKSESISFVKVGDLELFLNGVGLPDLIPKFTEHCLNLQDLLIMNDEELEKMGITQVGVRKKLLEASMAVHKKDWKNESLPNLKQKQYITCPDAVSMMANITKHLKYISTSVIYIRQQIQSQPRILELSQDSANVHNLLDEIEDSLKDVRFLNDEIRFLKLHLQKVQDQLQFIPADLIVETVPTEHSQKKVLFVAIGITALSAVVTGLVWKNPDILDSIPSFIRIRVPFLR